jgi:hypothetical protein
MDDPLQLWLAFWAGASVGVLLGAFIFSVLSMNLDDDK